VQALKNEPISIFGDGSQTRSFCYVDDLIGGLVALMETDDTIIGPMNLGNPTEFTMLELANKVIALTGSKSKMIYRPLPADDPRTRRPDVTLAQSAIAWAPRVDLQEGLKRTIEYFEARLKNGERA
jgi:UDP-glucuronate decarboxylase